MTRVPPWRLAVIGFAACTACAPAVKAPSTPQVRAEVETLAREALSKLDRATPEAPPCSRGWAESAAGYVVAVAEWAEQGGLRPGDQIVEVGGAPVTASEERARAYARVPTGGALNLAVRRQGQRLTLALPCRYQPELFRAERRTLEAASRADWEGCVAAAREAKQLAGYTAYPNVIWEHACTRAKTPSMDSPGGREFASLSYETARLLLRDSRYVPGGTTTVGETIRQIADDLRRSGASAQADDLESQFQAAMAALPRLELTWADNSNEEDGYLVERKVGQADPYLPIATLPPNTVTYADTSVEVGVTYCYRVRAFRASSYSNPSSEACAVPKPSTSFGTGR
jgi:hypothetical protein